MVTRAKADVPPTSNAHCPFLRSTPTHQPKHATQPRATPAQPPYPPPQNFKLNLMVDMLVLTLMEGEGGMVAAPRPGVGTPSSSTQVASFGSGLQRGGVGNGSVGAMTGSRRDAVEVIEEDVDDDY